MKNNIISLKPFIDAQLDPETEAYFAERDQLERIAQEQDEIWLQQRAIHGFEGEDDVPDDGGYRYFDSEDPDHVMQAFERLMEQQRAEIIEASEALEIVRGLMEGFLKSGKPSETEEVLKIRDPHPDQPLTLYEVVCLPELGGQLYVGDQVPARLGNISVKTLRSEVTAGRLRRVPPFNKNIHVSRTTLREWLELRRDETQHERSSSKKPACAVEDIRKRQRSTRSSLATERAERSANAAEDARLRIQQARERLKK